MVISIDNTRFSANKTRYLGIKMETRPGFFEKPDLMMNLVVETESGNGACGKGESGHGQDPTSAVYQEDRGKNGTK